MRILVLGSSGQVGWEANRSLTTLGDVVALDYPEIDFSHPKQLQQTIIEYRPQVIYNAVAYTDVDRAEQQVDFVRLINGVSPGVIAETAAQIGAVLIHFSTDYVFDGLKGCPYEESDRPNPINVYGSSKLEGELAIQQADCAYLIFRTSWVYSMRKESFVNKVLNWAEGKQSIRVVTDQVSNPTWARMLGEITGQLLATGGADLLDWVKERRGVYHLAGSGIASRLEWAEQILQYRERIQNPVTIVPALTSDFPTLATRPLYSALNCERFEKTFGLKLPPWKRALMLAMQGNC